jgi:hypothetical protein
LAGAALDFIGAPGGAIADSAGRFSFSPVPLGAIAGGLVSLRVRYLGFRVWDQKVQAGADTILVGLVAAVSEATARTRQASTVTIPGGACRLLEVGVSNSGGTRVARLRLIAP